MIGIAGVFFFSNIFKGNAQEVTAEALTDTTDPGTTTISITIIEPTLEQKYEILFTENLDYIEKIQEQDKLLSKYAQALDRRNCR